jgi:hypothetical protein
MLALDETYAPRFWRCDECRRVLGVVMRVQSKDQARHGHVRKLWVFRVDRNDADVPKPFTLFSRPRGLFKIHGVNSCDGVECSICGALNEWTLSKESFGALMSHFREVSREPV